MILYRATDGSWHRRQIQAGPGHETHDIPTDKSGLFVWLNNNFGSGVAATPPEEADQPLPKKEGTCPKCKFTAKMAQAHVENRKRSLNMQGLKLYIEAAQGWELSTVVEAIVYRLQEIAGMAAKVKHAPPQENSGAWLS
jgi:hypothetical protein